jgi:hypothetical protein
MLTKNICEPTIPVNATNSCVHIDANKGRTAVMAFRSATLIFSIACSLFCQTSVWADIRLESANIPGYCLVVDREGYAAAERCSEEPKFTIRGGEKLRESGGSLLSVGGTCLSIPADFRRRTEQNLPVNPGTRCSPPSLWIFSPPDENGFVIIHGKTQDGTLTTPLGFDEVCLAFENPVVVIENCRNGEYKKWKIININP